MTSEVATADCDGCAEERPVQQLEEVELPSGHTVVCCPDCRYHAEKLAAPTDTCEGCGRQRGAEGLEPTPMPDGRDLVLCGDCLAEAASLHGVDAPPTDERASADSATGTAAGGGDPTASGGDAASARSATDGGAAAREAADAPSGVSGKPATTDNVCDQCGQFFSIELFKVKTVDGRTELFCPECKEEGVREGLVRDVELRRSQAYKVLELDGGADDDEIRQAYLRRVKEVHPDRDDGNRSEFMLVKQAYERLTEE